MPSTAVVLRKLLCDDDDDGPNSRLLYLGHVKNPGLID